MTVECRFFGPLREAVGSKHIDHPISEDATLADVVDSLVEDYPELAESLADGDGALRDSVNVTLNKENINHLDGTNTPVEDGDVLRFASAVVGGAH